MPFLACINDSDYHVNSEILSLHKYRREAIRALVTHLVINYHQFIDTIYFASKQGANIQEKINKIGKICPEFVNIQDHKQRMIDHEDVDLFIGEFTNDIIEIILDNPDYIQKTIHNDSMYAYVKEYELHD
tara:strand:+ start:365 stop:754 length:390 start_codon:yes stop_codon:yes gene_type:complete